jgi:hypothetical protein
LELDPFDNFFQFRFFPGAQDTDAINLTGKREYGKYCPDIDNKGQNKLP